METEKMFELATRNKVRFPFRGVITVEDLWDLPVGSLDAIFKTLNSQLKQAKEESLLNVRTKQDEELDLQIEIVKHVVKVKLDEDTLRLQAKDKREKKQKIMEIMAAKQDESLKSKSLEELSKMIDELD